ncbi:hypothetical protein CTAYLR_009505 [Chrysophaeum taylorii]|uniref:Sulfotransferase n=1 Tax=Chrysophaeum taylorii TaxID=2483200 RepID=A0AAD7U6D7_9STRA|nr:hypothetical protein CTAYLR_009505 [Chrysophaeum taylorii]
MVARFMPTGVRNAVKLIAVLREPIARELSLFNHERWSGFDWSGGSSTCSASKLPSFEAYAGCQVAIYGTLNATQNDDDTQRKIYQNLGFGLWKGMYIIHLATWRRSFDRNRVFVMSYDNLKPEDKMATDIAKFLDLYPFNRSVWFPVRNDHTFAAKQRTITCAIRDDLQAIFQPWNDLLYKKLQEDQDGRTAPQTEPPFPDFRLHPCVPNGSSSSS